MSSIANIKVGANTGDFQKQMKTMVTQLKEVNSEFTLSATKAKLYGSEQDKLKVKQQELTSKVKLGNEQIKLQSDYIKKLTDDLVKNRSKNMELHDSIDKVNYKLQESIKTTGKNSEETKALKKELDGLKGQLNGNEKQFDTTNNKLDTNKTKLNNMKTALVENEKALKNVNKALSTVKLDEFSKKADNVANKLNSFGNFMSTRVTLPIVGAGVAGANLASDFEETANKAEATFGAMGDTIHEWAKSSDTDFAMSKTQFENSVTTFGSLSQDILKMGNQQSAEYGKMLTARATDISSYYNMTTEESSNLVMQLFSGETDGWKNLGITINDTTMAEYAHTQGIKKKISEMTLQEKTQLRINMALEKTKRAEDDFKNTSEGNANTTKIFTASIQNLGIAFGKHVLPAITPMIAKATEMITKFSNLDEGTQKSIVKFGAFALAIGPVSKGLSGVINVVSGTSKGISKFIGVMQSNKVKSFGGAIKDLGSKFVSVGKNALTFAGNIGKTVVQGVVSGAKAIGNFTLSLGKMTVELVKNGIEVAKNIIGWGAHKIATIASTIATNTMALAQKALNFVMSMNPIAKVIIIIGALVAAFVTAYNKCDWFREGVDNAMQKVKGSVESVKNKFWSVVDSIGEAWNWLKSKIKLPHFNIEGSFSLSPPSIPHIGVDWYWNGGIIDQPTILGNIGVGDKFKGTGNNAEAIIPLDKMYKNIDGIVSKRISQSKQVIYVLVDNTIDINGKTIKAISKETVPRVKKLISKDQEDKKIGKGIPVYV